MPAVAATMRRYLDQLACALRPGSLGGADLALRSLAAADSLPNWAHAERNRSLNSLLFSRESAVSPVCCLR